MIHPTSGSNPTSIARHAFSGAIAGAAIGAAITAAKQIPEVKKGTITKEKAIENTIREATGTGMATAAGIAAASLIGGGMILSILVMTASSAGVKYLWDKGTQKPKTSTKTTQA